MKILFTCQEQSAHIARQEIETAFASPLLAWKQPGIGLIGLPGDFSEISKVFRSKPLVFTQHIFPVDITLPAQTDPKTAVEEVASRLDPTLSYSVQARSFDGKAPTRSLSQALQDLGFTLDIKHPVQTVSIYSAQDCVYIGVSYADQNLSDWNGGMMHFSSHDLISRAECKLLEAFHVFNIDTSQIQTALDLGAAPGGWSNALAQRDISVVAVDPAKLDPRVLSLPQVIYRPMTAQDYLRQSNESFDLIVNDMKLDAREALDLLIAYLPRLTPNGRILTTFKLPKQNATAAAFAALQGVKKRATLLSARQLFHNRSEITVYFTK